jgi:hypothetical protein
MPVLAGQGVWGMISVDIIGEIRGPISNNILPLRAGAPMQFYSCVDT